MLTHYGLALLKEKRVDYRKINICVSIHFKCRVFVLERKSGLSYFLNNRDFIKICKTYTPHKHIIHRQR